MNVLKTVDERIERYGWTVIYVGASSEFPAYAYTVGFSEKGGKDFLIIGFPQDVPSFVFYRLAELGMGEKAVAGRRKNIIQDLDVLISETLPDLGEKLKCIGRHRNNGSYGRFMQVILPDTQGKLPGDPGADPEYFEGQMIQETCVKIH